MAGPAQAGHPDAEDCDLVRLDKAIRALAFTAHLYYYWQSA